MFFNSQIRSSDPEWTVCLSFRFDFFVLVTLHARLRWHSIWEKIDNRCYYVSTQLWINEKSIMETTGSNELQWVFLCCAPHWYTESAPRRKSSGMHSNGFALYWILTEPGSDELYWVLHWFVLPCFSIALLYCTVLFCMVLSLLISFILKRKGWYWYCTIGLHIFVL